MYTLIGHPQSRAMRVMWMLEEIGAEYDLRPAMPRSDEALLHNQTGKVPALIVDDLTLTDSTAILTYLADAHGVATFAAGTQERAVQDGHTHFVLDEVEGPLWTASKNSFLNPKDQRCADIKPVCAYEFGIGVERLRTRLGAGPYLMGDVFTVPDIIAAHCLAWARAAKFDVEDGDVVAYGKTCRARAAFQLAVERSRALGKK